MPHKTPQLSRGLLRTVLAALAAAWPYRPVRVAKKSVQNGEACIRFKEADLLPACQVYVYPAEFENELCFFIPVLNYMHLTPLPAGPDDARKAAESFCSELHNDLSDWDFLEKMPDCEGGRPVWKSRTYINTNLSGE